MTEQLVEIGKTAGAFVAIAGAVALAWKVVRGLFRTTRKLMRMADEVLGDGDGRPGWGRRLTAIEAVSRSNAERLTAIEKHASRVDAELRPNGGASVRDQLNRIEQATGSTPDESE